MKLLRFLSFLFILFCIFCMNERNAYAATDLYEDHHNGILTINYDNVDNAKMKICVSKDETSYYYNLHDGNNSIDIPLTLGNGSYTIRIYKNISDSRYSLVISEDYSLELKDNNDVYLQPNVIVNYDINYKAIVKANNLTKNCKTDEAKIKAIYEYVVDDYSYDYTKLKTLSSGYVPDIQVIYAQEKGICYDISAIMAAMLRSQGVYTKLVTGYTPNIPVYHAWNEIYDAKSNKWITVDATYDICKTASGQKCSMVKKDQDYSDIIYQY